MRQHLIVMRDGLRIDARTERLRELEWRQLPHAAEQAVGPAPREHDLAAALDPQRGPREQRQVRRALALGDDRQLVRAALPVRAAMSG